jgi:two-component system nitrogen regulation response regulator GlnG
LEQLVAAGKFRQDLLFRLNVFRIHLPALRDRSDDIPVLAQHFLKQFAPQSPPLPAQTLEYLRRQSWPGNIREFRNALERAAILARGGPLRPEHFQEPQGEASDAGDVLGQAVRQWVRQLVAANPQVAHLTAELQKIIEPALIDEVLQRTHGNRSLAAEWLGLDRATVRKKIQQYELEGGNSGTP